MRPEPCECSSADAPPFDHFLLTRFSVPSPSGDEPNDNWLQERFKLFERYCLPSVQAQTCQSFRWGVLLGPSAQDWVIGRLRALGIAQENMVVSPDWRSESVAREWIQRYRCHDDVLTSRLDSDDALSIRYIQRLHSIRNLESPTAVNFNRGLQVTPNGLLRVRDPHNPFISLFMNVGTKFQTVLAFDHDNVATRFPTRQIGGQPGWLQVIHGSNLANQPRGLPALPSRSGRTFIAQLPSTPYSPADYFRDTRIATRTRERLCRSLSKLKW